MTNETAFGLGFLCACALQFALAWWRLWRVKREIRRLEQQLVAMAASVERSP